MPDEADEGYRIIVDESSFDFRRVDDTTLNDLLEDFADALEELQKFHTIAAAREWGAVECEDSLELCQFLYEATERNVSPEVRRRLAIHMDNGQPGCAARVRRCHLRQRLPGCRTRR